MGCVKSSLIVSDKMLTLTVEQLRAIKKKKTPSFSEKAASCKGAREIKKAEIREKIPT